MKYKHRPFPEKHWLLKIPVANETGFISLAFDTRDELLAYTRAIPECVFEGVTGFYVEGDIEASVNIDSCKSVCMLAFRCDSVRREIKQ